MPPRLDTGASKVLSLAARLVRIHACVVVLKVPCATEGLRPRFAHGHKGTNILEGVTDACFSEVHRSVAQPVRQETLRPSLTGP